MGGVESGWLGYVKEGDNGSWGCGHGNSFGSGFGSGNAVGENVVVLVSKV
jgi:hypothetical protein